ncbi:hypothetical protein KTE19_02965 [Lentilactobacillus sp. IMAU92037]|jgi:hypothetical protein|uniref:hypothetical protein n=1 Tax=Lentilactobacillus TaxID=2767893 RepID=UPI001C2C0321|nr:MULTISPECIES: hypothetical protein [Lentilactobacillus]MBV0929683.1 hypothetical protein [Lentilactobacillus dabitei]MDM7517276.1 hypothetical protein [Lentilactobacillus sp. TOM.63]DAJ07185.1 MAG TPA: hypothetical protein [Caudoviricetes sp.]
MNEGNFSKHQYLTEFKESNPPFKDAPGFDDIPQYGKEIVDLLKKKDLTHEEAYASLQYAYNLIKYESNFLKI